MVVVVVRLLWGRGAGIRCHCPHVMMLPARGRDKEDGPVKIRRPLRLCYVIVQRFVARSWHGCGASVFSLAVRSYLRVDVMMPRRGHCGSSCNTARVAVHVRNPYRIIGALLRVDVMIPRRGHGCSSCNTAIAAVHVRNPYRIIDALLRSVLLPSLALTSAARKYAVSPSLLPLPPPSFLLPSLLYSQNSTLLASYYSFSSSAFNPKRPTCSA